jgi:hypothetical protein
MASFSARNNDLKLDQDRMREAPEMPDPLKLRELASWYREMAERVANPMIWEARLRTADDLDAEADLLEMSAAASLDHRKLAPMPD